VVDPEARAIERYCLSADAAPEVCRDLLHWQPNAGTTALTIQVQRIFSP
jgi:hypothetical protein